MNVGLTYIEEETFDEDRSPGVRRDDSDENASGLLVVVNVGLTFIEEETFDEDCSSKVRRYDPDENVSGLSFLSKVSSPLCSVVVVLRVVGLHVVVVLLSVQAHEVVCSVVVVVVLSLQGHSVVTLWSVSEQFLVSSIS